jgi:hypothetical protein
LPDRAQKNLRLLVSARDPGAAFHLCEVVRYARDVGGIEVTLVAATPALIIFERAGFDVRHSIANSTADPMGGAGRALIAEAERLLIDLKPDALLVGLSGPDCGIDEALIACANGIPTYALQDFWGDVNPGFGKTPGTYFVLDEEAAALTRARVNAKIIVTGSARHNATVRLDHAQLRSRTRALWGVPEAEPVLAYFGQPLWHLTGYGTTLAKTAAAFSRIRPGANIRYRPHPKEGAPERARALDFLAASGVAVAADTSSSAEGSLCASDLCCTCFSSCGLDHVYLNRSASAPLGGMLFLLFEPDVQRYYLEFSRLDDLPLSRMGLTRTVRQHEALDDAVREALNDQWRTHVWQRARATVGEPSDASARIVETVSTDVRGDRDSNPLN